MRKMSLSTGRRSTTIAASLFLCTTLMFSGCKSAPTPAPGVRNSDGSITNADGSVTYPAGTAPKSAVPTPIATRNADGSITNPDGSVTYPAGSQRASNVARPNDGAERREEARREEQQASDRRDSRQVGAGPGAQQTPASVSRVIPSGTAVAVTVTETLSASRNSVGDPFSGVLQRPLTSENGAVIFPRGTQVGGTVAASKGRGRFKGAGDLAIELTSIGGTRVSSSEYEAIGKGRGKRTGEFAGGGGALGAIIGGLAGGGKGALIGGLAGAGAGTAGAVYTGNRDVVIPSESSVTFTLTAPVTVR